MTATTITVSASKRSSSGKSPARRTRAEGKVPAIVYGPHETATAIAVNAKDVKAILAAPLGRNTVVTLDLEGASGLAMLKAFDHHPLTREIVHADFYHVRLDRPVVVPVPFVVTGRSKGIAVEGGVLRQIYRTLLVRCTPEKIPAKIELDITNLGLGESLHVRDLTLPEGVAVKLDAGQTIVSVVAPEKEEVKAAVPGAPGAPAAAAAPAAAGKDAKAAAPAKDAKAAPAKKK
ncbi:MAG: 50S ribosomal protein L25 [Polyangiales bacterium]